MHEPLIFSTSHDKIELRIGESDVTRLHDDRCAVGLMQFFVVIIMEVVECHFPVLRNCIHEQLHLDDEVLVDRFSFVGPEDVHPQFAVLVAAR